VVAVVKGVGPKPSSVRVRMYQVGFGDCFLLSFEYSRKLGDGRKERHVLIDFGSMAAPRGKRKPVDFPAVAQRVATDCNNRLDAIVVSHRHRDHLGGFANEEAAGILGELSPQVIVRPWTEDPALDVDAGGPLGANARFVRMLGASQDFSLQLQHALAGAKRGLRRELLDLAAAQIHNAEAIERLDLMAKTFGESYLHAGGDAGLAQILPGVGVTVLGPPTVDEAPDLIHDRAKDPEYWMLQKGLLGALSLETMPEEADDDDGEPTAAPTDAGIPLPAGPVRWLGERLRQGHLHSLKRLVTRVDGALNNTSLILLIEVGRKRMLFPGDAQIENWEFILARTKEDPALRKALSAVDLYKVGHHGSRNATPRSLMTLWSEGEAADRPMVALLSTRAGVHGKKETTAVPRSSLVTALTERMTVATTDTPDDPVEVVEVSAPTRTDEPFTVGG
jgi:hypothetical protein